MKKTSILPLLAVAAFVGQAWAAEMCLWNGAGDCWPLSASDRDNCKKNAWIFNGGEEGKGTMCAGGTFTGEGKNSTPPSGTPLSSLGCCLWADTETKCWDVYTDAEVSDCKGGVNKFWSGSCPDSEGACPTGTPVYDGSARTALGCCKWETESVCYTIYDGVDPMDGKDGSDKVTDCKGGDNKFWTGKCPNEGGSCPTSPPYSGEPSPIIKLSMSVTSNIVKAIHNGVNVQLMDNAKIQVYDLKGNLARSLELAQGSYNVELSNMPRGTYIVKVTGRSWKQTVTVPVK